MLKDIDCNFCLAGHSERRQVFKQNNEDIKIKSINLINENIIPILCIGENLEEKKQKRTKDVLKKQIIECLPNNYSNMNTIIAYEPIWAIGTGLTPTLEEIDSIHSFIKNDNKRVSQSQNFIWWLC